jgi:hypothetical protein
METVTCEKCFVEVLPINYDWHLTYHKSLENLIHIVSR